MSNSFVSGESLPQAKGIKKIVNSGNLLAGITVGAYIIPQSMAYGELAGIGPFLGLSLAAIPLIGYLIAGRNKLISVGPESAVALMAAAAVVPIADVSHVSPLILLGFMSILVGIILLVALKLHAEFFADLLSKPVLVGYLTGVAILMMASQFKNIAGFKVSGESVGKFFETVTTMPNFTALLVAAVTLGVIYGTLAISKKLPATLIAIAVAMILGKFLNVPTIPDPESALPQLNLHLVSFDVLGQLFIPALAIAVVAYTDVMVAARAFGDGTQSVDNHSELRALGFCQILTGCFSGGYPVSASTSRTALAKTSGAKNRWYSLFVVIVLIVSPFVFASFLTLVPLASLSAIIVYAAISLIDMKQWKSLYAFRRTELSIALICAGGVVILGILPGVILAVSLSILELVKRLARPHSETLGFIAGVEGAYDVADQPFAKEISGLKIFRYDAPLFFANCTDFFNKVMELAQEDTKVIILNMEANTDLDATSLEILEELIIQFEASDIELWFARLNRDVAEIMQKHGILELIKSDRIYPTIKVAVKVYLTRYPVAHRPFYDTTPPEPLDLKMLQEAEQTQTIYARKKEDTTDNSDQTLTEEKKVQIITPESTKNNIMSDHNPFGEEAQKRDTSQEWS